jgi:hypothetical protein
VNYKKILILFLFVGCLFAQNTDLDDRQRSADYYLYKLFENTLNNLRVNLQTSDFIKIDSTTNAIFTIDYPHHEIHEGDHYFVKAIDTLGSGDSLIFCMTVPDTIRQAHLTFDFGSQLSALFLVYEGATCTPGNTVTAYNNNRNSSNASMLTIETGVGITSPGTLIEVHGLGSGTNPGQARTGESGRDSELILKRNSTYLFIFISGAAANRIDYDANWYEHTPSN